MTKTRDKVCSYHNVLYIVTISLLSWHSVYEVPSFFCEKAIKNITVLELSLHPRPISPFHHPQKPLLWEVSCLPCGALNRTQSSPAFLPAKKMSRTFYTTMFSVTYVWYNMPHGVFTLIRRHLTSQPCFDTMMWDGSISSLKFPRKCNILLVWPSCSALVLLRLGHASLMLCVAELLCNPKNRSWTI